MTDDERLADLLMTWEERFEQGKDLSAEELCRECPELTAALAARILALKKLAWIKNREKSDDPSLSSPSATKGPEGSVGRQARRQELIREPGEEPIPGYRLINRLGSGGFGEAWMCEAPGGIFRAVKFVFGNLNSLDHDGACAHQELKALNRIKEIRHPFVLSSDRIEIIDGELVVVMELADKNLHDAYQDFISAGLIGIPFEPLLSYVRDVAEALDHLHDRHNLQHLDVKPSNLLLISNRVKVSDFGTVALFGEVGPASSQVILRIQSEDDLSARQTHCYKSLQDVSFQKALRRGATLFTVSGSFTPLYAPPEAFEGKFSRSFDQYSLALSFCELLTGKLPFSTDGDAQIDQRIRGELNLGYLSPGIRPVLARALSPKPQDRFPSCLAFVRRLHNKYRQNEVNQGQPISENKARTEADCQPKASAKTATTGYISRPEPIILLGMNGTARCRLWMGKTLLRIGRLEPMEVILDDTSVSRYHAEIRLTDNVWWLRDLGSTNGTRLNSVSLPNGMWPLRFGDIVQFGNVAFRVESPPSTSQDQDSRVLTGRERGASLLIGGPFDGRETKYGGPKLALRTLEGALALYERQKTGDYHYERTVATT